jgi:hypothetical protein
MNSRYVQSLLILLGLGVVIGGVILIESRGWLSEAGDDDDALRPLTRPLRLRVGDAPDAVGRLLEGLRVHHYRAKAVGEAGFRDWFYDTPDGQLARRGYSYRVRERLSGVDGFPWSIRLERERRFLDEGDVNVDVRSEIPEATGRAIADGAWDLAVTACAGREAPDRLRTLLDEFGIDLSSVVPQLVGELERIRYELTDKGRTWFELDHELWTFRPFDGDSVERVEDIVLDTKLKLSDPEILRRVRSMRMLLEDMQPFYVTDLASHERGRAGLTSR